MATSGPGSEPNAKSKMSAQWVLKPRLSFRDPLQSQNRNPKRACRYKMKFEGNPGSSYNDPEKFLK